MLARDQQLLTAIFYSLLLDFPVQILEERITRQTDFGPTPSVATLYKIHQPKNYSKCQFKNIYRYTR
jgi:hypothetical protein